MKRAWVVLCIAVALAASAAVLAGPAQALVPDGAHGWFWQMPQPSTGLNDVAFVGAGQVWAVGAGGTIQHSTDGGVTWAGQSTGSDADLWSVSFADDQHGWAVGGQASGTYDGLILVTTDGGAAWTDETPSGLTGSLTNASFVDAAHGWIGTADGTLLKTSDGGATWHILKLAATYKGYLTVDFVDATHGWAGGTRGRIWKTVNGGKTWTGGSLNDSLNGLGPQNSVVQLDFVDRSDGWVLGQDDWGDSTVMTTNDGGLFWRPVSTGAQFTTGICAASAANVWLVGQDWMDYYDSQAPTVVKHTSDGGFRWQTSTITAPAMPYAIAAGGDSVCAVGDGILISSDAGATWQSGSSGQQYWFAGADAVSATDVWAVDSGGALLHSSDGVRFAEQPYPIRGATALMGISFPDVSDGWVVGSSDEYGDGSVILHTSDGGATWGPQQSNLGGELDGVDFIDAHTGWAISDDNSGENSGANVTMQHTTDGGATWIPQFVAGNTALSTVDFVDANAGWAAGGWYSDAGPAGAVFSSTDGGFTWTREKLPRGVPAITGLQFLNKSDGWAVGTSWTVDNATDTVTSDEGWVLHTTDGGATWLRASGLDDSLATTVHFSDAGHGWVGGLNGVYATTDGGSTWQRVAAGDGVEAIAATDAQHVWAFGDGFLVSTLDSNVDSAAPVTLDPHNDSGWRHKTVTIDFSANDIGGSGVGLTQSSLDGGAWQPGATITVPAYADHHFDGVHTILYRSADNAGNQEQTESLVVGVDTLGPACSVPRKSVVDTGKRGALYFMANDENSGVKEATILIVGAHGRVLRTFVERTADWGMSPPAPYYWMRFKCTLKPGAYRVEVHATDWAGNRQVTTGRNTLRVVRSGAPDFSPPWWPSGLGMAMSSRLNHGLRPAWLLRQPGSPTIVHAASHRGAWKARHWPEIRSEH